MIKFTLFPEHAQEERDKPQPIKSYVVEIWRNIDMTHFDRFVF